ncbi:hypothetical protein EJ069_10385 [Mesorhizobium sp. M2A.F.Ca.ET.043.05.1.1]|uniref:hypothetical protein n=1 Tax=Mesorhizobium sp. M2A.F.Ca.ET.043.05.1.1 TaxID=2493671 RepID=UPI000F75D609|nr:hypothetical protein [Mesorhizobium sp. M2A.F.Ca.ET.043.05.1.1]AZO15102.1 hypothetical protein EJ069_10385 [Mesorhizobium sp. M2A.F.Ca.ET.043.05.1.1]
MQTASVLAATMLFNPDFFTPVEVSTEKLDADLASWQIGKTIRAILAAECSDGSCIDDPVELHGEIVDLLPELEGNLKQQARVVMLMCGTLIHERGIKI